MSLLNFDASTVAPDQGNLGPVPKGWYIVVIDESELTPTKDGGGAYLKLRFNIVDGQYQGRKLFARLNIQNANPTAVQIAYGQLSAICVATGVMRVGDSSELHNKPLKVKVKVRAATEQYEEANDIAAYKHVNDPDAVDKGPTVAGTFQPPAQPQQFAPPAAQQPWAQPAPQQQQAPQQFQQPAQQPWAQPAQAPAQAPVQQPWAQPPQQMPQQQQAPQQFAPPAAQQFQQPAQAAAPQQQYPQPWAQAPTQAAQAPQQFQQPAPQQQMPAPAANPAVQQFAQATPPWAQQPPAAQ